MRRREFVRKCVLGTGAVLGAPMLNLGRCRLFAGTDQSYSVRAVDLVGRSLVIDMLGLLTVDWPRLFRWHADPTSFGPADYDLLRESGINVFHPAVELNSADAHTRTLQWLTAWNSFLDVHSDRFVRIDACRDFDSLQQSDRIGVLLGMQNSEHFRSPSDVSLFYGMGQRVSQLTYNGPNRIGHGCIDSNDRGLTPFGDAIIQAMNEAGMIIDVSHAGDRTTLEAFESSSRPVLVTHSNCRALVPHPRCKPDDVIKAMAQTGGVIGITSINAFVHRNRRATLEDALDHFQHAARLVGVEHVGLGSDTDVEGQRLDTRGLDHPRRVYDLTEGLLRRGFNDRDVELILGGNFKRALATIFC